MVAGAQGARPQQVEIASLAERMGSLQVLRVVLAALVLGAGLFVPDVIGATFVQLLLGTAGYLILTALAEGLRRMDTGRGLLIISASLMVDGLYLAWVLYTAGGVLSPLRFLLFVHVIAVTLLASYRTGLKVTLWHSLLSFVIYYAQTSGVLDVKSDVLGSIETDSAAFTHAALFRIGSLLVVALVTARFSQLNERELKRRKADMEDLAAMAAELEGAGKPQQISETLLTRVSESFNFKRGVVLTGDLEDMKVSAFRGPGEAASIRPGIDETVLKASTDRHPQLKKQLDPDVDPRLAALLPFARNIAIFPMTAEGKPVGVLAVEHSGRTGRIERRVVDMVSQFVSHAALALENASLYQLVQKQAETDALTGIPNRRTFESTLEREMSRAARSGEQVTLAMFDIDHFKSLNDTYGHQTGDDVLKKVAQALAITCRDFDTPARYGGEEFAVILPSCSSKESLAVAERLREAIAQIDAVTPVTASSGVATFPTHAADLQSLIKAADEALYESKRGGRDRVTRSRRRARKTAAEELLEAD
jgi:two-component system, cell cycle response regulator